MSAARTRTTKSADERFPPQIKFIIGNEAAERFSYYGMRSILVMFMVNYLLMTQAKAVGIYHAFISAAYFFPLLGGFLADRFLGKYRTIFWLSLFYCAGHLTLAVFDGETGLYWGLGLIALGAGGIKPCVSAFVGDQFNAKQQNLLQRVYDIFYFSINFGSTFSTLLIPVLLAKFSPNVAFAIPGVLMGIATIIFVAGRKQYVEIPPSNDSVFLPVLMTAILRFKDRQRGKGLLSAARSRFSAEDIEDTRSAWGIIKVFAMVSIFWALYDQSGSSWILQAKQMDQNMGDWTLLPSQMHAANPILVMLLIPLFSYGIYPWLERRGVRMTQIRRMTTGMFLTGFSFIWIAALSLLLARGVHIHILWQIPGYIVLTAAEIMVSITGLEFAYTQAPRKMKSTIMSFWMLTIFAGNALDAIVAKINVFEMNSPEYYGFFTVLMFVFALLFWGVAATYKPRTVMGGSSDVAQ